VSAFDVNPKLRWLFCMTHPDDEISICAWIRTLVKNGNEVFVSWTHSNPVRESEARAVAHLMGIAPGHLFFFGATDGGACDEIPDLLPRFRQMMSAVRPDRVVCGAFEQGHMDHDATNYLVSHSFDGPIYEVPFYHTYLTRLQRLNRFSDRRGEEVLALNSDLQHFKKMVARQYPSQNIWRVLLWYEIYSKARLRPGVLIRTERMRLQRSLNYLQPNHRPRLAARVQKSAAWRRWVQAVRSAESLIADREYAGSR
jgi:LmbE family N-acetylglucosaminyl deacetylase